MFARFMVFGLCLLAVWLIWRAVRQWIDMSAQQRGRGDNARRIGHQRGDESATGWVAAAGSGISASGGRSGDDRTESKALRSDDPAQGEALGRGDDAAANFSGGDGGGDGGGGD